LKAENSERFEARDTLDLCTDSETYWSKVRKTQTAEYIGSIIPMKESGQADRHIVPVLCVRADRQPPTALAQGSGESPLISS